MARTGSGRRRRGATLVEMALTLPILMLVIFASLEFTRANMIRHTVDNAVYEAARRGIVPGATAADVEQAAQDVFGTIGVSGATVTVDPAVITDETSAITVTVDLPLDANGWVAPIFFSGKTVTSSLTLSRELFVSVQ